MTWHLGNSVVTGVPSVSLFFTQVVRRNPALIMQECSLSGDIRTKLSLSFFQKFFWRALLKEASERAAFCYREAVLLNQLFMALLCRCHSLADKYLYQLRC
ncbi:hypothetical protein PAERUG_P40_Scotland_4_VIM_2_09_12_04275 [Pseudomonas aeruginosa]|nr:hypothetical protein PAERUG_P40_Scotland_4_VIM_2_09_12_04275 [Pseudomonas aeruginosa]